MNNVVENVFNNVVNFKFNNHNIVHANGAL